MGASALEFIGIYVLKNRPAEGSTRRGTLREGPLIRPPRILDARAGGFFGSKAPGNLRARERRIAGASDSMIQATSDLTDPGA